MASSSESNLKTLNASETSLLTDLPRRYERLWIRRQPPSLFRTRPSGDEMNR